MPGYTNSSGETDLIDYMRMLERRLARLERGVQGSTGGDDPVVIASLAVTGLALTTQTSIGADDFYRVMLRYSWSAIPDDPSEYNKDPLDGYLTSWTIDGTHWTADLFTTDTFVDVGPFTQGQSVTFRVRARTRKGTIGAYSTINNTTTTDSTAPFQPSTPTVTPYLGQLAIDWNGQDVSAGQPPTDFRFCEVHLSTTGATFTPTVATLVGTILRGGGTWVATDLTYGSTYFARLVAVDTVGNRSPASTAGSGIPELLVNADVGANAIATANIQNLAVNNAKISDLSVGKLTVGTLTANMTVGARIMTAASGARVEMNINGIQAFNSGGGQTVDIASATGAATFTGKFQTGFPGGGSPYLDMVDGGDRTTITMYNAAGTNNAFINSPQDGSSVSMLGLNTGTFTYATTPSVTGIHRLFMANASGILLETNKTTGGGGLVGGRLLLNANGGTLSCYNGTGNVQDGGQVDCGQTTARLRVTNTGTEAAVLYVDDTSRVYIVGQFSDNASNSNAPADCIIAGNSLAGLGAAQTWTITYGATSTTRPGVVYAYQQGTASNATTPAHKLTNATTTNFTVWATISQNANLLYWAFRTT
jgi:hypothetical protein